MPVTYAPFNVQLDTSSLGEGRGFAPLGSFCKAAEIEYLPPVSFDLTSSGS